MSEMSTDIVGHHALSYCTLCSCTELRQDLRYHRTVSLERFAARSQTTRDVIMPVHIVTQHIRVRATQCGLF